METITKTINITARDIEKGVARSCNKCPAARALHRLFPDAIMMVSQMSLVAYDNDDTYSPYWYGPAPFRLQRFIEAVDFDDYSVVPGKYKIVFWRNKLGVPN